MSATAAKRTESQAGRRAGPGTMLQQNGLVRSIIAELVGARNGPLAHGGDGKLPLWIHGGELVLKEQRGSCRGVELGGMVLFRCDSGSGSIDRYASVSCIQPRSHL